MDLPTVMGSSFIISPLIAISAFARDALLEKVIQQYLAKDNFFTGSESVIV